MPYRMTLPDPETFIAENTAFNAKLYAELAPVPLYVNLRIIAPGLIGKRESFRLGWIISDKRLANGGDLYKLPAEILAWVKKEIVEIYPDHASSTGLSAEEVAEMEAEQKAKKTKHTGK